MLDCDDENLYKFNQGQNLTIQIKQIKLLNYLKIINMSVNSGGETEIRTQERVAPLPVFKTGAFNRSAISPLVSV